MSQQFDHELANLRREFTAHATTCFEALERAHQALRARDAALAKQVIEDDDKVDEEEVRIEHECIRLITLYNPVAADIRLLITMLKLNGDLERIADHAANICKQTRKIIRHDGAVPEHLLALSERVRSASRDVFQAFLDRDVAAARAVLEGDAKVDKLDHTVRHEVHDMLDHENAEVASMLCAYRISRELERVGDRLANMAEDTIYLITGEIIRHAHDEATASEPD